jgi:SAM-dependent methyltransferase
MKQTVRGILRTTLSPVRNWIAESPSTRDYRLIWYQIRRGGIRRALNWKVYDKRFYEEHIERKTAYYELARLIFRQFQPRSVIDFGCGNGYLLHFLAQKGVAVSGVEGSRAALEFIEEDIRDRVLIHDLTQVIDTGLHDLVISTEVAEHIPKKASATFVRNLGRGASRRIIFTAAKPGQWGDGHINCQPKDFWIELFASCGWIHDQNATEGLVRSVQESQIIMQNLPWLAGNLMVFINQ